MRKVLYAVASLLLASTAYADIDPFNVRPPVTIGTGPASEKTLQTILDSIYGANIINAATDQQTAGIWELPGPGTDVTAPVLRFEEAGNAGSNVFGIWSGHDPDASRATPLMVPIFNGPASPTTIALLKWDAGDPNTLHIEGSGTGVNFGDFAGISRYWFGFYLSGPGGTFFTADQLNAGGAPQALAYRNAATDRWTFAFEDMPYAGTDRDFNDLVVTAESITPVPEPGVVLLLGAMLLGSLPLARRLRQ